MNKWEQRCRRSGDGTARGRRCGGHVGLGAGAADLALSRRDTRGRHDNARYFEHPSSAPFVTDANATAQHCGPPESEARNEANTRAEPEPACRTSWIEPRSTQPPPTRSARRLKHRRAGSAGLGGRGRREVRDLRSPAPSLERNREGAGRGEPARGRPRRSPLHLSPRFT